MIEHDVVAEADHQVAHLDHDLLAAVACRHRSHPDRGEEDGEQAVEHDHQEDRFHHRGGGLQAERFGVPFTARPSTQATTPITSAMNGALIMPTLKC